MDEAVYRQMLRNKHPTNPISIFIFPPVNPQIIPPRQNSIVPSAPPNLPLSDTEIAVAVLDHVPTTPKILGPIPGYTPILNPPAKRTKQMTAGTPQPPLDLKPLVKHSATTPANPSLQLTPPIDSPNDSLVVIGMKDRESTTPTPLENNTPGLLSPGLLSEFNSAATSQTLDFTPSPAPDNAPASLNILQVNTELAAYVDNSASQPHAIQTAQTLDAPPPPQPIETNSNQAVCYPPPSIA